MFGYAKKIEEIIRESAFDRKKKKPGLKFNPGLALTGVRTTGPWYVTKPSYISPSCPPPFFASFKYSPQFAPAAVTSLLSEPFRLADKSTNR